MFDEVVTKLMGDIAWWGFPAALFIIGACSILKNWLEPKLIPVAAVVIGAVGGAASYYLKDNPVASSVATGMLVGFAAVGIYSGIKNVAEWLQK